MQTLTKSDTSILCQPLYFQCFCSKNVFFFEEIFHSFETIVK